MKTEELEEKLDGGAETQSVEFKSACNWDANLLAKDILALSNVQDGGYIIIGIEDENFRRKGITEEQKLTFNEDIMKDQMAMYADPHVNFNVYFPKDKMGTEYTVIKVYQFEEIPVICRKDSRDTKAGTLYYRNRNRRVESAPISNSYDMRDIIKLATVKMIRKEKEFGFSVEHFDKKKLDDELEGL